jgi:putative nucleotidyltransferase with HDIG domain
VGDEGEAHELHRRGDGLHALGAVIPGSEAAHGLVCVVRAGSAAFLPEERDLLVGFARHVGLALERLRLGTAFERHLVNTITAFVTAMEAKDPYLKGHSTRVAEYAGAVAAAMGLDGEQIALARRGGILHDLGKLGVLEPILDKPGPLTSEEYRLVQAHPEVGYRILQPLGFLGRESLAVRHHHERWDGGGYPAGLAGEDIPLLARIVAVADAFDAMTSDRPYRRALDLDLALGEIERGAGIQFDPAVAAALLAVPRARLRALSEAASAAPSHEVVLVAAP